MAVILTVEPLNDTADRSRQTSRLRSDLVEGDGTGLRRRHERASARRQERGPNTPGIMGVADHICPLGSLATLANHDRGLAAFSWTSLTRE